ncbi:MAG TPA: hypothetical protein VH986_10285 [Acidimicrobiia bacterium]|jgi:hypothetical protein
MPERARGFVMVVCGLLVLMLNVIEVADRGATVWNVVTIATGAFLLFYGTSVVARATR